MTRSLAEELLARARERLIYTPHIKPADVAVYVWVLGVLSYEGVRVVEVTASQIHLGVKVGDHGRYAGVGLSLNTIKSSLATLGEAGWLIIGRKPSTKGEILRIEIP